jgi:outer membrane protein TolC
LTRLVSNALEHNYDACMAIERVAQAEAGALSRLLPSVGVGAKASRYDGGDTDLVLLKPFGIDRLEFDRWQADLQASWELDLFGQGRARLAAAREQSKAAQADVQAVTLSVDASVANIYVNYRGLQKQQQLMLENLAIADEVVRIAERSFDVGVVKSTDVDLARADAAQLQARLAELDSALAQLRLNLENLCVLQPGALTQELRETAGMPHVPGPVAPRATRRFIIAPARPYCSTGTF